MIVVAPRTTVKSFKGQLLTIDFIYKFLKSGYFVLTSMAHGNFLPCAIETHIKIRHFEQLNKINCKKIKLYLQLLWTTSNVPQKIGKLMVWNFMTSCDIISDITRNRSIAE